MKQLTALLVLCLAMVFAMPIASAHQTYDNDIHTFTFCGLVIPIQRDGQYRPENASGGQCFTAPAAQPIRLTR